jgi:hypothetical protein
MPAAAIRETVPAGKGGLLYGRLVSRVVAVRAVKALEPAATALGGRVSPIFGCYAGDVASGWRERILGHTVKRATKVPFVFVCGRVVALTPASSAPPTTSSTRSTSATAAIEAI